MESIIYHPVFFTATIRDWKNLLKPDKYKIVVLKTLQSFVKDNKILLYAYCIMNNHIHLIWQVKNEYNPSEIQKLFLESTAKQFKNDLAMHHVEVLKVFKSTQKDRTFHFWKRRSLSNKFVLSKCLRSKVRLYP